MVDVERLVADNNKNKNNQRFARHGNLWTAASSEGEVVAGVVEMFSVRSPFTCESRLGLSANGMSLELCSEYALSLPLF